MSKEREQELIAKLRDQKNSVDVKNVVALLTLRRERHMAKIEQAENDQTRGRSLECKELLKLLTE